MVIEFKEELEENDYKLIDSEFNKYAVEKGIECNYKPFSFVAKEDGKTIGIITGHSYYKEVHIGDLIVLKEYKNKGFENINLTTYGFQAPEFYKKCGFTVEYVRENKESPKISKYFLIKNI